ncbi:DUF1848 domain-containing protein [Natranaerobius thermophilus]|uniref:DUF1848 domain-containing protein n=1 Tax=Natranaerobius thermophilus (strain ATCC BAA-1301 / DSM 18059 / JW/NM-WN-LF) TaxID=457570 RepID=B2A3C6_NATTJ|nr:DUF1848 domain-containing protein [Natranaerobius thermophilus]ACB86355.1 protein of unknown function DUF1848 [Natranaerobius thermophilus JW/NM-WN-LF]
MQIISASRRTDIPAFFGEWFKNRIKEGFFYSVNPFNPRQIRETSLRPEDVACIVFWTKNPRPFFPIINLLNQEQYFYYFQYTLNNYPDFLEPGLPSLEEQLSTFKRLNEIIGETGPDRVQWRYDPIIISSRTPIDYHLGKIDYLAATLEGYTKRLTVSLLDFYKKISRRFHLLSEHENVKFYSTESLSDSDLTKLGLGLNKIAKDYNLELYSCCDRYLAEYSVTPGSCIDGELISSYTGIPFNEISRDCNQREYCLCSQSVDMGIYSTCKHFCSYCYAYGRQETVEKNLNSHYHINNSSLLDFRK